MIKKAIEILNTLYINGFDAYIVGGYVRDSLLGISSNDIDITTNATLDDLKKYFKVIDNGGAYSSYTISYKGSFFEITHFRRDISYNDHRHPVVEEADNIYDDLARRDYTINALAYDRNMNIIDKYNGLDDIKNKKIKLIGNENLRYKEDALRIFRGIYLISKLGFELDNNTYKAMCEDAFLLNEISGFRKEHEMRKIIKYNKNNDALKMIVVTKVIDYLPGLDKGIRYLCDNNIVINDVDIFYILSFSLNGSVNKDYNFDKKYRKRMENIIKLICGDFKAFDMLDKSYDDIFIANKVRNLLNMSSYDDIKEFYSLMPIKSIRDIDISPDDIKLKNKSKVIDNIALMILDNGLKNDNGSIIKYLEMRNK